MSDITKIEDALYQTESYITLPEAVAVCDNKIPKLRMISWAKKFGIGIKVGGRWKIDPEKLALLLKGQLKYTPKINPNDKRIKRNR